jgi:hypothetical protein
VESAWAEQLGAERFAQLRALLVELNEPKESPTTLPDGSSDTPERS